MTPDHSHLIQSSVTAVTIAVTLWAVYTDCRWRIIKNSLTFPAIAAGLVLHALGSGWPGLLTAMLGLLIGGGLMMIPFVFGQMGAGDVKLMGALGSLLGAFAILNVFLYTTLAGGLLAFGFALYHENIAHTLKRVWSLTRGMFGRAAVEENSLFDKKITMPYGLAIGIGTFVYLAVGRIV